MSSAGSRDDRTVGDVEGQYGTAGKEKPAYSTVADNYSVSEVSEKIGDRKLNWYAPPPPLAHLECVADDCLQATSRCLVADGICVRPALPGASLSAADKLDS